MPFALYLLLLSASPEFTVAGADGAQLRGQLVELSAEKTVLNTAAGPQTLPAANVSRIAAVSPPPSPLVGPITYVGLVDGSRLHLASYLSAGGKAAFDLGGGIVVDSPTAPVRWVRFREQSPEIGSQWDRILARTPKADMIVIRDGAAIDYLEGVIGDVTAETVNFTLDGETVPVKRTRVEGLIYYRVASSDDRLAVRLGRDGAAPADSTTAAPCVVADAGGSVIQTLGVDLVDGKLRVRSAAAIDFELPLERAVSIEFPAQYLSQWRPERTVVMLHTSPPPALAPLVEQFYRPRFDEALESGPLKLGDRDYARGLALHSRTELAFLLPEPFKRFTAVVGIDDRVRPGGNVRLVIRADERVLLDRIVTGAEEPLPISLDLTGAARLHILVDYGDDASDAADHLDIVDPRLFK